MGKTGCSGARPILDDGLIEKSQFCLVLHMNYTKAPNTFDLQGSIVQKTTSHNDEDWTITARPVMIGSRLVLGRVDI